MLDSPPASPVQATQQVPGSHLIADVDQYIPAKKLSFEDVVHGIATRSPRALGGEVAAALIAANVTEITNDRDLHRGKLGAANDRILQLTGEVAQLNAKLKLAENSLNTAKQDGNIKGFLSFVGVALAGIGVDKVDSYPSLGSVMLISGMSIAVAGWLVPYFRK